jgi:hypothetical protein
MTSSGRRSTVLGRSACLGDRDGAATCLMPYAEAGGHLTDEDVFRDVS